MKPAGDMLTKLCALFLLALVVSPFTAPFRTVDLAQMSSPVLTDDVDPGSLLAPCVNEARRLKIATTVGIETVTHSVSHPPVTFIARPVAPAGDVRDRSVRSTVLRL